MTPAPSAQGGASGGPALRAIAGFALVTADLAALTRYYCDVLGFAAHGPAVPILDAERAMLGVTDTDPGQEGWLHEGWRQVLSLGGQTLWLDQFAPAGRPYPADGDAASLWFQHLALVVDDMAGAYRRVCDAAPISRGGPQRLPDSSGGVTAFKFRDPDGHPLELLQFPDGAVPDTWRHRRVAGGAIGLGIDHSAISVSDAEASVAFYQALGLRAGERTLNHGPAQERLDGLPDVSVAVVPLTAGSGTPHLELLGYRTPRGRAGPAARTDDMAATRIVWEGGPARLIRDPDGHLHQVCAGGG